MFNKCSTTRESTQLPGYSSISTVGASAKAPDTMMECSGLYDKKSEAISDLDMSTPDITSQGVIEGQIEQKISVDDSHKRLHLFQADSDKSTELLHH